MGHSAESIEQAMIWLYVPSDACLTMICTPEQYFETFSSVGELTRVPVKSGHAEYAAHTITLNQVQNLFGCSLYMSSQKFRFPTIQRSRQKKYNSEMFSGLPACVNIQSKFLAKPYLYIS